MKLREKKRLAARVGFAVSIMSVAALAAACGGSDGSGSSSAAGAPSAGSNTTIGVRSGPTGTYVTDNKGDTLYMFASDTPTSSSCSGACATAWPPLTTTAVPTGASGVTGKLGTVKDSAGDMQVTLNGHPLYLFAGDSAPGQTKGEGINNFGAEWLMLTPSGQPIAKAASSSPTDESGSDAGGGWS